MKIVAERANEIEKELGLNFDDVLNKITQEMGEFNDAVQKYRGRYCRKRKETLEDVEGELGDLLFNLASVCNRLGINPDDFPKFAKNTFNKFEKRKNDYIPEKPKVTICGSIAFFDEMVEVKKQLEKKGYLVKMPPQDLADEKGGVMSAKEYYKLRKNASDDEAWIWERKAEAINWHFEKVDWSDAVLVLNYEKRGVKDYVGANTLMEMGLAFHLGKKIYLLNGIPEIGSKEEILGMKPIVINGDLSRIK